MLLCCAMKGLENMKIYVPLGALLTGFKLYSILILSILTSAALCVPLLVASPDYIPTEKTTITFKWANIPSPSVDDYIGLESPANGKIQREPWTTWRNFNAASSGMQKVELLNWRSSYRFHYYRANGEIVASSNVVSCNQAYPTQIHLALGDQVGSMRVMWVSGTNSTVPTVNFGFAPDQLTSIAYGVSTSYNIDDLCGLEASQWFLHPGIIHDVLLTNLPPNTLVYYQVVSAQGEKSAIHFFRSAPLVGPDTSVSLFAFGDSGVSYCQNMTGWCEPASGPTYLNMKNDLDQSQGNFSLVVHIGDIAYAVGYADRWEQFFHEISPLSTRLPWMVSIGNHEYDYKNQPFHPYWGNYGDDSHGECGIPFQNRFHMPGTDSPRSLWYSFDYGNIHFTFMSAEHDLLPGSPQYEWLVWDLNNVDRKHTPFVIFSSHRPLYTTETEDLPANGTSYIEGLRMNIEPLLAKYQVDLALWAHVHAYERTCPIFDGQCTEGATTHAVIGMAGMDKATQVMEPAPEWIRYREIDYGYTRITTTPQTLTLQFVNNREHKVKDEFTLTRKF